MNIAEVTATCPPYRGGIGAVAHEYAVRLRARGHVVQIFTARRHPVEAHEANGVQRLRGFAIGNAAVVPALYRRLRAADLVHLHYPFFGGAEWVLLRKMRTPRQPLIVSYYMDATAGGLKGRVFDLYRRVVLPRLVARADRILVSSLDYAQHSALARFPEAAARLEVHPFGVDLDRFHPGSELSLRARLRIEAGETVLLFVGTLDAAHHFKGLPVLFESLAGLTDVRWRLVVVGDGPHRPSFEALARTRGLAPRVTFTGSVSDEELPAHYRLADCHVFPSTGRAEAFGLVALEAAASGIPTVASHLPGVRTVIVDGETGLLVPPGEAAALRETLRHLLDHPSRRRELGRHARARAEREFAWEPQIDRLERTYRQVLPVARGHSGSELP